MSKYPEDEFDEIDQLGLPAGVHRTPRSAWSKIAPFAVVVVLCAALAIAVVYVMARTPGSPLDNATSQPSASADPDPGTDETEPAEDPVLPGDDEVPAEEPAPEEPSEPEAPVVDTAVAVRVLNGTGLSGVAATAADTLTGAGWTDVSADNYTGAPLDATVVWYKSEDLADTAMAVADALDIPADQVTLVPELRGPLSVILAGS